MGHTRAILAMANANSKGAFTALRNPLIFRSYPLPQPTILPVRTKDTMMRPIQVSLFENLLTMEELLTMLKHQYSVYTVYRWVQRQGMPHRRIKGKLWFPKSEVIQWLERGP
jgi:predicted DNA-binding transcriptional regulator AlpA